MRLHWSFLLPAIVELLALRPAAGQPLEVSTNPTPENVADNPWSPAPIVYLTNRGNHPVEISVFVGQPAFTIEPESAEPQSAAALRDLAWADFLDGNGAAARAGRRPTAGRRTRRAEATAAAASSFPLSRERACLYSDAPSRVYKPGRSAFIHRGDYCQYGGWTTMPVMVEPEHLLRQQGGVATSAQLLGVLSRRGLQSRLRTGELIKLWPGIYGIGEPDLELRATGQVILFDGFLKLYQEGRDDEEDEENRRLPQLKQGESVKVQDVKADQHFTEPPPRYSEASLVKKLEELGIGRPSTYAAILEKLRERNYVKMDKNRFIPDDRGRLVIAFLENFFSKYVEYDFTADLEGQLDQVSAGELSWKKLMRDFWKDFNGAIADIGDLRITQVLDTLNEVLGPHIFPPREDGKDARLCPLCNVGQLSLRLGKYGAFVGCSNYNGDPPCKFTRPLAGGDEAEQAIPSDGLMVGDGPNGPILLKSGRFGAYFETPNPADPEKPKRASVPKGQAPTDVSLETAIKLLSLPREVGMHPSENELIVANIGRFGPYIKMGNLYVNLPGADDVHEIQMNRAVALIEEKKAGGGKGRFGRAPAPPIKELGESPVTGKPIRVLNGRYGPYITDGETNANTPKDKKPEDITVDEALSLLAARAEAGGADGLGDALADREVGGDLDDLVLDGLALTLEDDLVERLAHLDVVEVVAADEETAGRAGEQEGERGEGQGAGEGHGGDC